MDASAAAPHHGDPPATSEPAVECVIEAAPTARSKCRGCGQNIARDEQRFGERLPNPFGKGLVTLWFHLQCAAYKRPAALLEGLAGANVPVADAERLRADAERGIELRRLPRIDGADLSTGARARCRHCHEMIVKGAWRIPIVFFEEGAFNRRGFIHATCGADYFETPDLFDRVSCFSLHLEPAQHEELKALFHGGV